MTGKRISELASPSLYPVCSPSLIKNRGKHFKTTHLNLLNLLHDNQVSWDRWFKQHIGSVSNNNNIQFPNTSQALTAAYLGYGVALGNEFETQEFIKQGQLITLIDKSIPEERNYFLYCRHEREESLKSRIFEDWIVTKSAL